MNNKFPIVFILISAIFFIIDVNQFFLLGTLFIPFLLCIYCSILFYTLESTPLTIITIVQCLEMFCFYNNLLLPLVYIIPVTTLAIIMKKVLYSSYLHIATFTAISFVIYCFLIENTMLGIIKSPRYTLAQISAIILVEICFSLTIQYWDMLDNRA